MVKPYQYYYGTLLLLISLLFSACENPAMDALILSIQEEVEEAQLNTQPRIILLMDEVEAASMTELPKLGSVSSGETIDLTFTVRNDGGVDLNLEVPEVWPSTVDFLSVLNAPDKNILAKGETTTFDLRFTAPETAGTYTASLHVNSNDPDTSLIEFTMEWIGYQVDIYPGNGEVLDSEVVIPGRPVPEPLYPSRTGYFFGGWYFDEALTSPCSFDGDTVTQNMALYAKWSALPGAPVTYFANTADGSPPAAQWKLPDEDLNLALDHGGLSKPGYSFTGWDTRADGTGQAFAAGASYSLELPLELYAQWSLSQYTVIFDTGGGSAIDAQTVYYQSRIAEPETPPARDSFGFAGWFKDEWLTIPWNFTTELITANTTVYAAWRNDAFTVSFESDGGTPVQDQSVTFGFAVVEPTSPVKISNTFSGWYTEVSGGSLWNFTDSVTGGDITLYARWELIEAGKKILYTDGLRSFNMVQVPGIDMMPLGSSDDELWIEPVNPYEISETEVTYALWITVAQWAKDNGFSDFTSYGEMGDGTDDTPLHPVMDVNVYLARLWSNALTEWYNHCAGTNLTPCYVDINGNIQRDYNSDRSIVKADIYYKEGRDGFRLSTLSEWELAARWSNDDTYVANWGGNPWFTKGNTVSGGELLLIDGYMGDEFAWSTANSGGTVHPVAQLLPNDLGIYDMCGNGFEWVEPYGGSNSWEMKGGTYGGGWRGEGAYLKIGEHVRSFGSESYTCVIRLARSILQ